MMIKDKNKITHTKDSISKEVARELKMSTSIVRDVIECIEDKVSKHLSEADARNDVSVRLFEGISISSKYVPESEHTCNFNGKNVTVSERIQPRAHITRSYREKITERAIRVQ